MRRLKLAVPGRGVFHRVIRANERKPSFDDQAALDLSGDRAIEWSWLAAQIPDGRGEALDFGCGQSDLGLIAAHRGFRVTAVDLEPVVWPYTHARLRFLQGDILKLPFSQAQFDLVLNCSAVEHVGLVGRYSVTRPQTDGDLEAMARMRSLMKPRGTMLLSVPVGRDAVFSPWHRIYGAERLPRLLDGFSLEVSEFWVKDVDNRWIATEEATALSAPPLERLYGLGCFVLSSP